jgi:hypothetical protein
MTMTAPVVPGTWDHRPEEPAFDPRDILGLGLPAHVLIQQDDRWSPAWLIGREHCADGWVAMVQYVDTDGREQSLRLPADQIAVSLPTARRH